MPRVLILMSTAKGQNFQFPNSTVPALTSPRHLDLTKRIVDEMKNLTTGELGSRLGCSASLASAAVASFAAFVTDPTALSALSSSYPPLTRPLVAARLLPAIHTFDGVAFEALDARNLSPRDLSYACENIRILDPLYGVLRGSDGVQEYRLELGIKVMHTWRETITCKGGKRREAGEAGMTVNGPFPLKKIWKPLVTNSILEDCAVHDSSIIFDASSIEYSELFDPTSAAPTSSPVHIYTCKFTSGGKVLPGTSLKTARGLFARYCCENNVRSLSDAQGFDLDGFAFEALEEEKASSKNENVKRSTITFADNSRKTKDKPNKERAVDEAQPTKRKKA